MNNNSLYVEKYSDSETAAKWVESNILKTDIPPVTFTVDGKSSRELEWTKTTGEHETVVDFAKEAPFRRYILPITYNCAEFDLTIKMNLTYYPGYPVLEYDATIYNDATGNSLPLSNLKAIDTLIECNADEHILHAAKGSTYSYEEFKPLTYKFYDGYTESPSFSSTSGKCTMEYIPYFNVENPKNNSGTIAIMNWQGTWNATFSKESEGIRMNAGQYQTDFILKEGEEAYFPGMVLMFYRGNRMNGQNLYRRWIYQCNLFRKQGEHMKNTNILIGSTWYSTEADLKDISMYTEVGLNKIIDKFNIDASWYPMHGSDWTYVGDWFHDAERYPNGLKEISDAAHSSEIDFAVWFEPERVLRGTKTAEDLREHIIAIGDDGYACDINDTSDPNQHCLVNYADKEAVDYMVSTLDKAFKEYGIDQYRQDFNISPAPYWNAKDAKDTRDMGIQRTGITENHYCKGYIEVWDRLLELNPGMYFDACASGGMRYDLETMRASFLHTRSDYWQDIESAQVQTYGSSMWFLYWGTGLTDLSDYDVRSHIGNSIGVGITGKSQAARMEEALLEWRHLAQYMFYDYYPLTGYIGRAQKTMALQYDSPENGCGMFITYFRSDDTANIAPRGLAPNAKYVLWDLDDRTGTEKTMTGAEIMAGIEISAKAKSAVVYEYKLADGENTEAFQKTEVKLGVSSDTYNPDDFVYPHSNLIKVDPPKLENTYVTTELTDTELKALYNIEGENKLEFVSFDKFASGTIYAISKNIYDEIVLTGETILGGWKGVSPQNAEIFVAGAWYPMTQWDVNHFFQRQYVKEIDGTYFMWFTNTVGLSDTDGAWSNWKVQMRWTKKDGSKFESDRFLFHCESKDITKITYNETGELGLDDRIYKIDPSLFGSFVFTGYAIEANDRTWYEIDEKHIGFITANLKSPGERISIEDQTNYLNELDNVKVYAAISGEDCFLYVSEAGSAMGYPVHGRCTLSWKDKDGNCYAHSFLY